MADLQSDRDTLSMKFHKAAEDLTSTSDKLKSMTARFEEADSARRSFERECGEKTETLAKLRRELDDVKQELTLQKSTGAARAEALETAQRDAAKWRQICEDMHKRTGAWCGRCGPAWVLCGSPPCVFVLRCCLQPPAPTVWMGYR